MTAFVLAGTASLLGGRLSVSSATAAGTGLQVTYAAVSRPGHDAGWVLEVRRRGGFDRPVRVAVDSAYLDLFDQVQLRPEPRSSSSGDGTTIWEFEPPAGDTLRVRLEARFDQEAIGGRTGRTAVLEDDGSRALVQVEHRSLVLP